METKSEFAPFILHWLITGVAFLLTSRLVSGFKVKGLVAALFASVAVGLVNAILWPILFVLTLPLSLVTFGLFIFVINGAVLKVAAALMPGFAIESWWAAIWGAMILSIVNLILHGLLGI